LRIAYRVLRIAYCVSVIGLPGYQEMIIRISGYQGDPFLIPCCADFRSPLSPFLLIPSKEGRIFDIDYLPFTNMRLLVLSPCCAAAYDMQTEMSSSPAGGLCLPSG